jgi:hypothetical protein
MVDVDTPPDEQASPKVQRSAALIAAAVAVPVALLAGVLMFVKLTPDDRPAAAPAPSAAGVSVPDAPVPLAAPRLTAHDAQVCLAVTSQLPARLRDLPPRKVSAGPEQNAAYGEPPITVRCGVPMPALCRSITPDRAGCVPLDADLLVMNGVCWYGEDGPATKVFTTLDREVAVQVAVPAGYQQAAQWANEFSDPVVRTVKSRDSGIPTGCGG